MKIVFVHWLNFNFYVFIGCKLLGGAKDYINCIYHWSQWQKFKDIQTE